MPRWISQDIDFQEYVANLPPGCVVALDTEFDWTRTYFPRFALLQIGLDENRCALVDPFTITDWTPLRNLLTDPSRTKVVFSGRNDLPILVRACGGFENCRPVSIQDLQIAMGFSGRSANDSLKTTIEDLLGISLTKTETRSDWTQRPLEPKQLEYAADDVVLLPKALQCISEELRQNGNWEYFLDEMHLFEEEELFALPEPSQAWRRVSAYHRIHSPEARNRIRALAHWREKSAQENDISRNRLLPDEALLRLALASAVTPAAIMALPRIHRSTIKRFQEELLAVCSNPEASPEPPEPQNPLNTSAKRTMFNHLVQRIQNLLHQRAEAHHVDPTLLGARHDIESLVLQTIQHKTAHNRLLTGWRAKLLEPTLSEILNDK